MKKRKKRRPVPATPTPGTPEPGLDAASGPERMAGVLRAAGYDPANELDWKWGRIAWEAAIGVHLAAADASEGGNEGTARAHKVGRNAPCPCGSGKKHKRCCLEKVASGGAPARDVVGRGPAPNPRVVPNLADASRLQQEVARLVPLFSSDPALKPVRFPSADVIEFLDRAIPSSAPDDAEAAIRLMDTLAFRFARETSAVLPADLGLRLLDAARRPGRSLDELRALAAGVVLATAEPDDPHLPANPLFAHVFRLSAAEAVPQAGRIQDTMEGLALEGGGRNRAKIG